MAIFGMPNLLNNLPKAAGITLLGNLATDLVGLLFPGPNWGVYKVGTSTRAVEVSSVVEQDISAEARTSDYIIQTGSFTTYNKVRLPDVIPIRMTKDGSETSRLQLLDWLNQNLTDTTLFDILSPETRYSNATLVGFRISRSARSGAAMIVADCLFQQVREKPAVFSSSQIAEPENKPASPAARVYAVPDDPRVTGSVVSW